MLSRSPHFLRPQGAVPHMRKEVRENGREEAVVVHNSIRLMVLLDAGTQHKLLVVVPFNN